MTLKELCWELNISESTMKNSFPRTKKSFEKRGIIIEKHGRGENADYIIRKVDLEKEGD